MRIYDIDFTPEQIKALKLFYKKKSMLFVDVDKYIKYDNLNRCLEFLRQNHFVKDNFNYEYNERDYEEHYVPNLKNDRISITCAGENAYLIYCANKRSYFAKLLLSKWCDIIVAIATSVLINVNWDSIVDFVKSVFSK